MNLAFVSVSDSHGAPLTGLTRSDFVARIGTRDVRILEARPATETPSVVVVVDGIAADETLQARACVELIVTTMRSHFPHTRIALMADDTLRPPTFLDATDRSSEVSRAIGRLYLGGRSAPLVESIRVAAVGLAAEQNRRRVIVVITHNPTPSGANPEETAEAMRRADAQLWALGIYLPSDGGPSGEEILLREGSRLTGGRFNSFHGFEAGRPMRQMANLIVSAYAVRYEDIPGPPATLRIGVMRRNAIVSARGWNR
jgi:hypothetical protein